MLLLILVTIVVLVVLIISANILFTIVKVEDENDYSNQ